jgi:hypothetical protein
MAPPIEYPISTPEGHNSQHALFESSITSSDQIDQKPVVGNCYDNRNHHHHHHHHHQKHLSDISLNARLKHYQRYLDDHDTLQRRRSKWIAMKKYCLIMQSIKVKSKDLFQFEYHEEDDDDDDELVDCEQSLDDLFDRTQRQPSGSSVFKGIGQSIRSTSLGRYGRKSDLDEYNKILRRHRARIVNDSNQYSAAWDSTTDHLHHDPPHYSNDVGINSNNNL